MSPESPREKLPFEPRQKKKKTPKKPSTPSQEASQYPPNSAYNPQEARLSAIPDVVSKRMIQRMVAFSGIPTFLGVASFFAFYWIVSHQWFNVPTPAVVFTTMGLFGLGVLGLSYGILSSSWDEQQDGSWWGWQEFRTNLGRTISAWKAARQEAREKRQSES